MIKEIEYVIFIFVGNEKLSVTVTMRCYGHKVIIKNINRYPQHLRRLLLIYESYISNRGYNNSGEVMPPTHMNVRYRKIITRQRNRVPIKPRDRIPIRSRKQSIVDRFINYILKLIEERYYEKPSNRLRSKNKR